MDARSTDARPAAAYLKCPRCQADAVLASGVYGLREQILFVLGASVYRCHNCEDRHAQLGSRTIPLGDPTEDKTPYVVAIAIATGLVACAVIALWVLRRAHRWPF